MYMEPLRAPCMAKVAFGLRNLVGVDLENILDKTYLLTPRFLAILSRVMECLKFPET